MRTFKFVFLFTTIFSLILVSGCKKDDDTNPDNNAPGYNMKTLQVPEAMTQSNNPGAQQATAYVNMANSIAAMSSMFTPPKSTPAFRYKDGDEPIVQTWTVDDGDNNNYIVTLTITEDNDLYRWEMKINGTMDGHQMDHFTFIKAEQSKEKDEGYFIVYDYEKPLTVSFKLTWKVENDVYYLTFEDPQSIIVDFVINPDNSGSVNAKEWAEDEYHQTYTATWDATGHGTYIQYENGEIVDQGSW